MLSKSVSKSGHNVKEMVDNYVKNSSVVLPQRHLALISLSLGFLVIWTSVISGVLVSHTFRDNVSAKESLKIFQTHKQIGKIVFAIGHEMGINYYYY
jgi:triacylglycerol esterase/lipase EstA (alpha/beta hydrolase family)